MTKIAKPTKARPAVKTIEAKAPTKTKAIDIEIVSKSILDKFKALNVDRQLQSEIEWCLGSYSHDKNPIGLFQSAKKALPILREGLASKTKGITAKFISDVEKSVKA